MFAYCSPPLKTGARPTVSGRVCYLNLKILRFAARDTAHLKKQDVAVVPRPSMSLA